MTNAAFSITIWPRETMKLLDALTQEGNPFEIPDCSRDDLPQLFVDMGFTVGAEVGVYKGEFSKKLCEAGLSLYAVDPWSISKDYNHPKGQARLDQQYNHTRRLLTPYPRCQVVRKTSMEAVEDFPDESLDFVYIDGNHEFKFIAEDISEWSKKVKSGGIVSGHDYFYVKSGSGIYHWHVAHVLHAYLNSYNITNWYLLGRKKPKTGERRDKWRSWMFVKP